MELAVDPHQHWRF